MLTVWSVPTWYGGLGIQNPAKTADREYEASKRIARQLTDLIINQDQDLSELDRTFINKTEVELRFEKEKSYTAEKSRLENLITSEAKKRAFSIASEKGSSSWLSALPLRSLGYCLNKKDFPDSLLLRYYWPILDVCKHCACGRKKSESRFDLQGKGICFIQARCSCRNRSWTSQRSKVSECIHWAFPFAHQYTILPQRYNYYIWS